MSQRVIPARGVEATEQFRAEVSGFKREQTPAGQPGAHTHSLSSSSNTLSIDTSGATYSTRVGGHRTDWLSTYAEAETSALELADALLVQGADYCTYTIEKRVEVAR